MLFFFRLTGYIIAFGPFIYAAIYIRHALSLWCTKDKTEMIENDNTAVIEKEKKIAEV